MTTAVIILCIVACAAVVVGIVAHLGAAIPLDKRWRTRIARHHASRSARRRRVHSAR